jgi:stage V sporulation protein AE
LVYFWAFVVGGTVCALAQLLLMYTKLTPAHVLVLFVSLGAIANGLGLYEPLIRFAGGGALTPVSGFGSAVVSGIVQEVRRLGWIGLFTGVFELTGLGIAAAILVGFSLALVARPKG